MADNLQQPDRVDGVACILSNEPASPLRETIEALTSLGACLTVIAHSARESKNLDRGELQNAVARCLVHQRRAVDAARELRRLGSQIAPDVMIDRQTPST